MSIDNSVGINNNINMDNVVILTSSDSDSDFSDESGYTDNFNIEIKTDKINKFLKVAYK